MARPQQKKRKVAELRELLAGTVCFASCGGQRDRVLKTSLLDSWRATHQEKAGQRGLNFQLLRGNALPALPTSFESLETITHEGSIGLIVQIMTLNFGAHIEDAEERLNEYVELVRRNDEPAPDLVKACIVCVSPKLVKTHVLLYVGRFANFRALRAAAEDYLGSRRASSSRQIHSCHECMKQLVMTTWTRMNSPEKGGKETRAKTRTVARKQHWGRARRPEPRATSRFEASGQRHMQVHGL